MCCEDQVVSDQVQEANFWSLTICHQKCSGAPNQNSLEEHSMSLRPQCACADLCTCAAVCQVAGPQAAPKAVIQPMHVVFLSFVSSLVHEVGRRVLDYDQTLP